MPIDSDAIRRKRLAHRSRYRGLLESDLIFRRFVGEILARLSRDQLNRYELLLEESDVDLFAWVAGIRPVPARHDNDVMALLQHLKATPMPAVEQN